MKRKIRGIAGIALALTLMLTAFAGCGEKAERPVAAQLKTDLRDAEFTLAYGDLRAVLPADQLAMLFETTNKKTDDKTVTLSYYELVSKYGEKEYFEDLLKILPEDSLAALEANRSEALEYFNGHINDIKKNNTADVRYSESFRIDHGDGVLFKDSDGNELPEQEALRAAFRLYADTALKNIGDFLMNSSGEEAEKPSEVLYRLGCDTASELTLDDLYAEDGGYPIYTSVVPTLVYDLDENGDNAEDGEGEFIFVPTELSRTVVMTVKPEEASVKKAFTVREKDSIMSELKKAEGYMTVNSFDIGFRPCKITAAFNGETDEMSYVTYEKNMVITADVTFTGAMESYGTVTVEFPCTSSLTYNFGWSSNAG